MSKITIGQYYPANSPLHGLDPRIKLIGTFMHIAATLAANNFFGYGIAAFYVIILIKFSQVPASLMLRGLRTIIYVLIFAMVLNLFLAPGENVLVQFWFISITAEGIILAIQMGLRLVIMIVGTSMLTLTTSPIKLTDGLEALLRPLKLIKVPSHDIAMMMTIALRFIPTLSDEMGKIMKAQTSRGASFNTGGILKRAKGLLPILIPLFVSAFKRADELATAMESRCYRGDAGRTKMKEMKMTPSDWIALGVILTSAVAVLGTRWI